MSKEIFEDIRSTFVGMRKLFSINTEIPVKKDNCIIRPSVRGIILRSNRVAMVYSALYHYYKFPGGGMEQGESQQETLIREVREEAGLIVRPESIRPYGSVYREKLYPNGTLLQQENYYYFCEALPDAAPQQLDAYEEKEGFILKYVDPHHAIQVNRCEDHGPKDQDMLEREASVLEQLIDEGFLFI